MEAVNLMTVAEAHAVFAELQPALVDEQLAV
jgi:hypothetical protein